MAQAAAAGAGVGAIGQVGAEAIETSGEVLSATTPVRLLPSLPVHEAKYMLQDPRTYLPFLYALIGVFGLGIMWHLEGIRIRKVGNRWTVGVNHTTDMGSGQNFPLLPPFLHKFMKLFEELARIPEAAAALMTGGMGGVGSGAGGLATAAVGAAAAAAGSSQTGGQIIPGLIQGIVGGGQGIVAPIAKLFG